VGATPAVRRALVRGLAGSLAAASIAIQVPAVPSAATQSKLPERFTALAIPATADFSPAPVDITITRWSTEAEHDHLMTTLLETGNKGFLKALSAMQRVGGFGASGAVAYPIRYARRAVGRDGRERITLATDRDVAFFAAANPTRSLDYPITWMELVIRPNGEGEGQVAVAAKIGIDRPTKTIVVENYDIQPVRLNAIKRLK
jgi:hypothetical protein